MILVSVGTFVRGFDALVGAADAACAALGLPGFAQVGHSSVTPRHLAWERFLPEPELRARLEAARVVVCHGGMGILGEAMRAGRPILAVPRAGPTTRDNPANDQRAFLARLAEVHPIRVCPDLGWLETLLDEFARDAPAEVSYRLQSDVPELIARFLAGRGRACGPQSLPARSS